MNVDEMRKRYEQMLRDSGADEVAIRVLGQAYERDFGLMYRWCGSKRDAEKAKRDIHNEYEPEDRPEVEIAVITFPTTKAAILSWLNANFTTDNG